jgi:hypothetical protein
MQQRVDIRAESGEIEPASRSPASFRVVPAKIFRSHFPAAPLGYWIARLRARPHEVSDSARMKFTLSPYQIIKA